MALVLIKEDGAGRADANSYADVPDADAYHEGHLYASAWAAAAADKKAAALVMATRLIDSQYRFNGFRAQQAQALQWPREWCPDPDEGGPMVSLVWWRSNQYVASNVVPKNVVDATCEMARELLVLDRTTAPPGEGLSEVQTPDLNRTVYSKKDVRPIISHVAQAMLSKFGELVSGGSGAVPLVRV